MSTDIARLTVLAQTLRHLHQVGQPLLLVNVWDAASAARVESAGALAVGTSSAAVAASNGTPDDNSAAQVAFDRLSTIVAAVGVPVTADLEGGYGLPGSDLVGALLEAGAVGCNIEDSIAAAGDGLLDADQHAKYLAEIRDAAQASGVPVVLNARIDTIIRSPDRQPAGVLPETIRRAQLYAEAGADCVYPIGLRDPEILKQITDAVPVAVNANPSVPLQALAAAGAARISFGAGAFMSTMAEFQRRAEAALAGDLAAFA